MTAVEFDELFWFAGGGEQALGMTEWEHFVIATVEDQQGCVDTGDLTQGIVLVPYEPADRKNRKHTMADVADGCKRFFENDATDGMFRGKINGNR